MAREPRQRFNGRMLAMHLIGWVAFFAAAVMTLCCYVASSLLRVANNAAFVRAARSMWFRTGSYRVMHFVGIVFTFTGFWRLSHEWTWAAAFFVFWWFVATRLVGLIMARSGLDADAFLRGRWAIALSAYLLFQAADVVGSVDFP